MSSDLDSLLPIDPQPSETSSSSSSAIVAKPPAPPPQSQQGPIDLEVRYFYIPFVSEINTRELTFSLRLDIDFVWTASAEDIALYNADASHYRPKSYIPSLVVQNAKEVEFTEVPGASGSPYNVLDGKKNFVRIKVYGVFLVNLNVRNFPFDSQALPICVTVTFKNAKEVIFIPENIEKDCMYVLSEFKAIQDWDIVGCSLVSYVDKGDFPFAFLKGTIYVRRVPWNFVIKQMLAVTCTTSLSLCAFVIDSKTDRLNYLIVLLLTIVGIQFAVAALLPPSPYMCLADKLMFSCMLFIMSSSVYTVFAWVDDQDRIDDLGVGIAAAVIYATLCATFFALSVDAYKKSGYYTNHDGVVTRGVVNTCHTDKGKWGTLEYRDKLKAERGHKSN